MATTKEIRSCDVEAPQTFLSALFEPRVCQEEVVVETQGNVIVPCFSISIPGHGKLPCENISTALRSIYDVVRCEHCPNVDDNALYSPMDLDVRNYCILHEQTCACNGRACIEGEPLFNLWRNLIIHSDGLSWEKEPLSLEHQCFMYSANYKLFTSISAPLFSNCVPFNKYPEFVIVEALHNFISHDCQEYVLSPIVMPELHDLCFIVSTLIKSNAPIADINEALCPVMNVLDEILDLDFRPMVHIYTTPFCDDEALLDAFKNWGKTFSYFSKALYGSLFFLYCLERQLNSYLNRNNMNRTVYGWQENSYFGDAQWYARDEYDSDSDDSIFGKPEPKRICLEDELNYIQASSEPLEAIENVTNEANLTFVDERPMEADTIHVTGEVSTSDMHRDIAESKWSMDDLFSREIVVARGKWTEAHGAMTELVRLAFPKCITDMENAMLRRQISTYGFIRSGAQFRVQINGNKFVTGALLPNIQPLYFKVDIPYYEPYQFINYPHSILYASVSNSCTLEMPFTHLLSHFPTRAGSTDLDDSTLALGHFSLVVLNPLRAAEGSSNSISYTVYCKLVDPEMHIPVWPVEKFSFSDGLVIQGEEAWWKKIFTSGLGTALGAFVKTATGGLATGIGDVLTGLFFDKPIDPLQCPAIMLNRSAAPLCHGVGLDASIRLSLCPMAQTNTTVNVLGGTSGDFSLKTLCEIPSLITTFSWSTSDEPSKNLYEMLVTPCWIDKTHILRNLPTPDPIVYNPTMLAYVCRAFALWRGALEIKIQIVSTEMHSGRLALIYDPTWTKSISKDRPIDVDTLINLNCIIIDIQEQKEVVVKVPFVSIKPWLRAQHFQSNFEIQDGNLGQSHCGIFQVVVLNELVCPNNVPTTIDLNIYISAGEGFDLAVPCTLSPLKFSVDNGNVDIGPYAFSSSTPKETDLAIHFPNKEYIRSLYWRGQVLYLNHMIEEKRYDGEETVLWFECRPTEYVGSDAEAYQWYYQASEIGAYNATSDAYKWASQQLIYHMLDMDSQLVIQAAESWTSTRSTGPAVINILKDCVTKEVAPDTLSENSMNLQTVLRRYYPLVVGQPIYSQNGFTVISIPVSPTFSLETREEIEGYVTRRALNHIIWFCRLFTYWRGGMRYKVFFNNTEMEIYIWHEPTQFEEFRIETCITEEDLQRMMVYATTGGVAHLYGSAEVEVPFFSTFNQLLIDVHGHDYSSVSQNGLLKVAFRRCTPTYTKTIKPLTFSVFVSTADDFVLNIIRPPSSVNDAFTIIDLRPKTPETKATVRGTDLEVRHDWKEAINPRPDRPGILGFDGSMQTVRGRFELEAPPMITQAGNFDIFGLGATKGRVDNALENINQLCLNLNQRMDQAENTLAAIPSVAKDIITRYTIVTAEVLTCGAVLYSIKRIVEEPSFSNFVTMAIATCGLVGLSQSQTIQELISSVVGWVISVPTEIAGIPHTQALDGAVGEAIDQHSGTIAAVVAVLGTIFYAYLFDVIPNFSKIKEAIKSFFETDEEEKKLKTQGLESIGINLKNAHFSVMGIKALDSVFSKIMELINQFIAWILDKENPQVIAARNAAQYQDRIVECVRQVDEMDYEPNYIEALSDPLVHNRFYRLYQEISDLTDLSIRERLHGSVLTLMTETRRRAQKLMNRLELRQLKSAVRYDPFMICIHGATRVGKTKFLKKVIDICKRTLGLAEYNMVYAKNIADDYYSNYSNQPIIVWDEWMQNKEADKKIAEWMALRGNTPLALNMAAVDDKGKYFTSQVVIMTTNTPYAHTNSVRDNAALLSRRHFMLKLRKRENMQEINMDTVQEGAYPNWEHCHFERTSALRDVVLREYGDNIVTPYEDFEADLTGELERWHRKQMAILNDDDQLAVLPRGIVAIPEEPVAPEELPEDNADFEEMMRFLEMQAGENDDSEEDIWVEAESPPAVKELKPFQAAITHKRVHFELDNLVELSDEEMLNARVFLMRAETMSLSAKNRLARIYKNSKRKLGGLWTLTQDVFTKFKTTVIDFFSNNPRLAKLMGLTALMCGLSGLLLMTCSSPEKPIMEGAYESGPMRPVRAVIKAEGAYESGPRAPNRSIVMTVQGSEDPTALEIRTKIHKYVGIVSWKKSNRVLTMRCFQVRGEYILAPFHFFRRNDVGSIFTLLIGGMSYDVEYQPNRLLRLGDNDWCLYACGPRVLPGKDLVKHFIYEKDLCKVTKFRGVLCSVSKDGVQLAAAGNVEAVRSFKYNDPTFGDVYAQKGWKTDIDTKVGDCGSILMAFTNSVPAPGKVVGVHVCGSSKTAVGYSVLVVREQIETLLNQRAASVLEPLITQSLDSSRSYTECRLIPKGKFYIFNAVMPAKLSPAQPQKTGLMETPFHDLASKLFQKPKIPAHLKPFYNVSGERISPLSKAIAKYGHDTELMKQNNLNKIFNYMVPYLKTRVINHTGKRIFDTPEAILGIPGLDHAERMNMKSSPGWPYQVLHKDQTGKNYLFDEEGNIIDSLLKYRLEERLELAKRGQRIDSVWRDCLKDELRPVAKVESGSTRVFTIAPVDFTIAVRKYFMDFIIAFYSAYSNDFFSAVGMNPESMDWTVMYDWLTQRSSEVFASDHKLFDGKLKPEAMMLMVELVNEWYDDSEENKLVRKVLFDEMIHTVQLVENCCYMTVQGNPSGNPLTVIINTFVNLFYHIDAFLEIYPDATIDDFFKYIRAKFFGDDSCVSVPEKYKKFNQNTVIQYLSKQGLDMTTELKDGGKVKDFRHIDEVTFLKRGFRRDPEFGKTFILPTLDKSTLYSYLFYYRKCDDVQDQLQDNMRAALRFSAFHGRQFYDNYHKIWSDLMCKVKMEPITISFDEQVDVFLAETGSKNYTVQGMEKFMKITNHRFSKFISSVIQTPLYYTFAAMGILASEKKETPSDDRWAVAIPSGEGKSYLAKLRPDIFVDHDELLFKHFGVKEGLPWSAAKAVLHDFPKDDRRILLVHHPDNTNRRIIGSFIEQVPSYIRANIFQRLRLKDPYVMSKTERNVALLQIAQKLEPQLFEHSIAE